MATVGVRGNWSGADTLAPQSSVSMVVDLSPIVGGIHALLDGMSADLSAIALYNTLNSVGAKMLTQVRRDLAKQTSIKYGRIMAHVKGVPAHPGRLSYRIEARDTAIPLWDFRVGNPKPGAQKFTVKVWGKQRTFKKNVFVMDHNFVKRVGKHFTVGKGKLNAKVLWGPVLPNEMLRPGSPTFNNIQMMVQTAFLPRLEHEIEQAMIRASKGAGAFIGPLNANHRGDRKFIRIYRIM